MWANLVLSSYATESVREQSVPTTSWGRGAAGLRTTSGACPLLTPGLDFHPENHWGPRSSLRQGAHISKAQQFPRPLTSLGFLRIKGASAQPGRPLQLMPLVRTEQAEGAGKVGGYSCRDCSFPGLKQELLKRKMTYLQMQSPKRRKRRKQPVGPLAGSRASGVSEQSVSCESCGHLPHSPARAKL